MKANIFATTFLSQLEVKFILKTLVKRFSIHNSIILLMISEAKKKKLMSDLIEVFPNIKESCIEFMMASKIN